VLKMVKGSHWLVSRLRLHWKFELGGVGHDHSTQRRSVLLIPIVEYAWSLCKNLAKFCHHLLATLIMLMPMETSNVRQKVVCLTSLGLLWQLRGH
jgi:hypothetical protein